MINKSELLEYFLSEAEDHVNALESGIAELSNSPEKSYLIEELFRVAHTLKGSAALVKLNITSNIAHKMEDILEALMQKRIDLSSTIFKSLTEMLEGIKTILRKVSRGAEEYLESEQSLIQLADKIIKMEKTAFVDQQSLTETESKKGQSDFKESHKVVKPYLIDENREKEEKIHEETDVFISSFIKLDAQRIEDMLNLIGEVTIKKNYLLQKAKNVLETSDEIFFTGRRLIREVNEFAERNAYALPENVKYIDPLLSEFGELEFDRYDQINVFSRKLQEITNDMSESLRELSTFFDLFSDNLKSMDSMLKILKANLTESRMVDIGILFQRFTKPTKEIAKKYNKKVELKITGGLTKIDRVIFERLFSPLMHLVMNAITHGIESSEERIQKNKKPIGTLSLSAHKEGGIAVIEITDDGKGIDLELIRREAMTQGLLKKDDSPSEEELIQMIFIPGFSTSEVTDISAGRGMGMSAVKRMVSGINGILEVQTIKDVGTTFKIKVPLSLAISNVLLFRSGALEFVIPSNFIEEVIHTNSIPSDDTIVYRDKKIILINLSEVLGIPTISDSQEKFIIICSVSDKKIGLIVEDVIGQEETVIKTMHGFLEGLQIYSGTTISGDGTIRFVLNPVNIFDFRLSPFKTIYQVYENPAKKTVLIVDDSVSVRKHVSSFLESKNFKVYSASNGVEGLNILYDKPIDIIITDLEMPVMHGYELINRVKSSREFKDIPIVVLTSRSGDKHREKALLFGVNDYLVKPFDEESLLNILRKYFEISYA
ncbi:MAG: hybrid sensor histidine kinase/response regulator [Thermodesulfovibrionales bacterium]|nr:hybrid sensor histidine kinase/response regulator [Thermodesulfovibrionales bacterium]